MTCIICCNYGAYLAFYKMYRVLQAEGTWLELELRYLKGIKINKEES